MGSVNAMASGLLILVLRRSENAMVWLWAHQYLSSCFFMASHRRRRMAAPCVSGIVAMAAQEVKARMTRNQ